MKHQYQTISDMFLFVEVARCGSFRLAASRLEMPVATLSRRIAQLEKAVGMQLLVRTTRSVALAQAAQPYYDRCLRIVEAAHAAQEVLVCDGRIRQRLRVSMPVDLGAWMLGPLLAEYCAQTQGLQLEMDLSTQAKDLFRDPIDLVFRIGRPLDDRVVARKIGSVHAGIYAAPRLIHQRGTPETPQDLESMPCLDLITAAGPMPWKVGGSSWRSAPGVVSLRTNNMGLLHTLTKSAHGVALLPKHLADPSGLVQLFPSEVVPPWPLYAITASRSVSATVRNLLAYLSSRLGTAL